MGKDLKGKELGPGISQRKDGLYCGRYVNAAGKRCSVYHKKLGELRSMLREEIYNDKVSGYDLFEDILYDDWFDKWINTVKAGVIRETTRQYYLRTHRLHISPTFGKMSIGEISQIHVKSLLVEKHNAGYTAAFLIRLKAIIHDIFEDAVIYKYIKDNPTNGVKTPPKENNNTNKVKALSQEQQKLFLQYSKNSHYNNAFRVQVNTGLRPGELFALTLKDIDFENKRIRVNKTLSYYYSEDEDKCKFYLNTPKTSTSIREVPINRQCMEALLDQIELRKKISKEYSPQWPEYKDVLFISMKNSPITVAYYREAIVAVVNRINREVDSEEKFPTFSGHVLRHTFATRCLEAGIKPKVVQKYLGHKNIKMTMDIYTHVFNNLEDDEMLKLENLMA